MKKSMLYILAVCTIGIGCRKSFNDTIGGQTPDQRLSAALAIYQQKLSGAPYGWILIESTTGTAFNGGVSQAGPKAVFAYYMQFNDSNKVAMFSDFDTTMAVTPGTSSYLLKALQRPVLIFDTYSYIHVPCDPNTAISKSPFGSGFGWGTDFEFSFADNVPASTLGDTIRLTGDLNGAAAVLVKATQQQHDAYYSGQLKPTMLAMGRIQNYFKYVSAGGSTLFEMTPSLASNSPDLSWLDASGKLQTVTPACYYTPGNVNFVTPVSVGSQSIGGLDNLSWDSATAVLSGTINGSAVTITGAAAPLKNDSTAPYTWWMGSANSGSYYFSNSGFHANGTDDYYGVTTLPGWHYMLYWSEYGAGYDAFVGYAGTGLTGPAMLTPSAPGVVPATGSIFTPDGRIIFLFYGSFGSRTSVLNKAVTVQATDPSGYYLVLKEDGKSYDMVVASDAKAWIRWSPWWLK
jgi:Domain of unknown function (DUF4302)